MDKLHVKYPVRDDPRMIRGLGVAIHLPDSRSYNSHCWEIHLLSILLSVEKKILMDSHSTRHVKVSAVNRRYCSNLAFARAIPSKSNFVWGKRRCRVHLGRKRCGQRCKSILSPNKNPPNFEPLGLIDCRDSIYPTTQVSQGFGDI